MAIVDLVMKMLSGRVLLFVLGLIALSTIPMSACRAGVIAIDGVNFSADPASQVNFGSDGSSTLFEDYFLGSTLLTNAPPNEPETIFAGDGKRLSFRYSFAIGTFDSDDLFSAVLLQGGLAIGPAFEFWTGDAGAGIIAFDLSDLAGLSNVGLEFSLVSGFDGVFGSEVVVSDLRLETIPAAPTLFFVLIGLWMLRRAGNRAASGVRRFGNRNVVRQLGEANWVKPIG